jgi:ketosteroid isomerase-like protein
MPDSPAGGYRGHDGIREWMANLRRTTAVTFELGTVEDHDGVLLAEVVARGRGESSDVPLEWTTHTVVRLRGDKLHRVQAFLSRDDALDAVSAG